MWLPQNCRPGNSSLPRKGASSSLSLKHWVTINGCSLWRAHERGKEAVSLSRLGHNVRLPACYCYCYWYWVSLMTRHRSCNWNLRPYDDSNFGHNKGREREREREWKVRGRDNWPRVFFLLWLSLFSLHCLPHTHTHTVCCHFVFSYLFTMKFM